MMPNWFWLVFNSVFVLIYLLSAVVPSGGAGRWYRNLESSRSLFSICCEVYVSLSIPSPGVLWKFQVRAWLAVFDASFCNVHPVSISISPSWDFISCCYLFCLHPKVVLADLVWPFRILFRQLLMNVWILLPVVTSRCHTAVLILQWCWRFFIVFISPERSMLLSWRKATLALPILACHLCASLFVSGTFCVWFVLFLFSTEISLQTIPDFRAFPSKLVWPAQSYIGNVFLNVKQTPLCCAFIMLPTSGRSFSFSSKCCTYILLTLLSIRKHILLFIVRCFSVVRELFVMSMLLEKISNLAEQR